jgi:hypothetical protein
VMIVQQLGVVVVVLDELFALPCLCSLLNIISTYIVVIIIIIITLIIIIIILVVVASPPQQPIRRYLWFTC